VSALQELTPEFVSFIRHLPKVELHLHLEGGVQPETLRELSRSKGRLEKETRDWVAERAGRRYQYRDFQDFLQAFKLVALLLETPSDYAMATTRLIEGLTRQNVKYAEIIFAAGVVLWKEQPVEAIFEAVASSARAAREVFGVRVQWIFDAVRHFGVEHVREVLRWAGHFRSQGVVALGIGGDEMRGPAELFREVFREARAMGLHVVAHAGEACGPESVRQAVEALGAERIGHGLTAARDPAVLALLRDRRIPLEVCLTSNVATGALARIGDHPLPQFLDAGLVVTLNTDDPAMFGTDLVNEYLLAARSFDLTREQILHLGQNAIRAAFLSEEEKLSLLSMMKGEREGCPYGSGSSGIPSFDKR
jgi:adenosine deaminase/aminodeoxyfutalosine deaminase